MGDGRLKNVFGRFFKGELFAQKLPKASAPSQKDVASHIGELIPDNLSFFPDIVRSLRSKNFFIYFVGQLIVLSGLWIQQVAMSWLVLRLSPPNSFFEPSLVLFLANIPTLFITPFAGLVCDAFDRRKILMTVQSLMMVITLTLAYLTISGQVSIGIIYAFSFTFGVLVSFDAPARQSIYCELVPPDDLSNAIALNSIAINATRFVGPAVGGFLIGLVGEGWCFFINGLGFLGVLAALFLIKPNKLNFEQENFSHPVLKIKEGIVYTFTSIPLMSTLLILMLFCLVGAPFIMMLHTFVKSILGLGSSELGIMMSCIGCGTILSSVYLAARKSVLGLGRLIMICCISYGAVEIAMSFVETPIIAGILCVPLGFCMISIMASCNTLLQTMVEDSKRGRIMSLFSMAIFGMPPIGIFLFGTFSDKFGIQSVMMVCGIICIIAGLIFLKYRPLIRKHTRKIYIEKGIISEIAVGLNIADKQ